MAPFEGLGDMYFCQWNLFLYGFRYFFYYSMIIFVIDTYSLLCN